MCEAPSGRTARAGGGRGEAGAAVEPAVPDRVRETHVSTLLFRGDRVYKCKKPVRLPFLDLSDREARRRACEREVELNSRLSPDVYLGVADVTTATGEVEPAVVMRRLPEARSLEAMVRRADPDAAAAVRAVARAVAAFHGEARRSAEIDLSGRPSRLRDLWWATVQELSAFTERWVDAGLLEATWLRARRYLEGRAELFALRIAQGRIRDGHGDLLAADVFLLDSGPRILDCLEFDDGLRHGDVCADIAFLVMDLERLGRPDLAELFVSEYTELSGEGWPPSLLHHYVAYRALVRAKVACLRAASGDGDAAAEVGRLLGLAFRHAELARVVMVLVGGLPGTGKSTLAGALTDSLGWTLLRSDSIRQELGARSPGGRPAYDRTTTLRVYSELLRRARTLLRRGWPVVLDASWHDAALRAMAVGVATDQAADLAQVHCRAPREVAERRITRRRAVGGDPSEATPGVARWMAAREDPWPGAVDVWTDQPPTRSLSAALRAVGCSGSDGDGRRPAQPSRNAVSGEVASARAQATGQVVAPPGTAKG